MAMSPYYRGLRERIGSDLLLIPAVAAVVRDERGRLLIHAVLRGDPPSRTSLGRSLVGFTPMSVVAGTR